MRGNPNPCHSNFQSHLELLEHLSQQERNICADRGANAALVRAWQATARWICGHGRKVVDVWVIGRLFVIDECHIQRDRIARLASPACRDLTLLKRLFHQASPRCAVLQRPV